MFTHAQTIGVKLPPSLAEKLDAALAAAERKETVDTKQLQGVYNTLLDRLAPATPQSIYASASLDPEVSRKRKQLVGTMLAATAVSLSGYLYTLHKLGYVEAGKDPGALLAIHLLAAAGLGAAFNALFTVHRYLVQRTFDPKYTTTYVIRFALGLVAGVILAQFINPEEAVGQNGVLQKLTPGLIALLGGYAAEAVHLVLKRIVEMLVALVQGGAEARIQSEQERLRAESNRLRVSQRLAIVQRIAKEAKELGADLTPDQLRAKLEQIQTSILEEETS